MTPMPTLFDEDVRASDPPTSERAARKVTARRAPTEQAIVEQYRIAGPHGLTDDELVALLAAEFPCAATVKSARSRITTGRQGRPVLLVDSGLPPRASLAGADMTVWVLAKNHVSMEGE